MFVLFRIIIELVIILNLIELLTTGVLILFAICGKNRQYFYYFAVFVFNLINITYIYLFFVSIYLGLKN